MTRGVRITMPVATLLCCVAAAMCCGCMQIEIRVTLHDRDGGATVTERLTVSRELLDLDRRSPADALISRHLTREAALERLKQMGKGIELVEHRATDKPDGSRESLAVYRIPVVEDLRIINPLMGGCPPDAHLRFEFQPNKKTKDWEREIVTVVPKLIKETRGPEAGVADTPLDIQAYRDLIPIFADMMKDLKVAVIFETPTSASGAVRGSGRETKAVELLSFSGRDLDAGSRLFLENEEIAISLLRGMPHADNIVEHTRTFAHNPKVPVLRYGRWFDAGFWIVPTEHMREKYFKK
ncbi:MAG: hypothetical protein N3A38_02130 [Planctomycetota bacterium]|nr:hypothetical protein [Planctomycetota bacterium]